MKAFIRNFYYRYEIFRMHRMRKSLMRSASTLVCLALRGRQIGVNTSEFVEGLKIARETLVQLDLEINLRRIAIRSGLPKQDAEFFNREVVYRRLGYVPQQEIKIN